MLPLFLDWAAAEGQVRHLPTIQAGDQAVKVDLCTYDHKICEKIMIYIVSNLLKSE